MGFAINTESTRMCTPKQKKYVNNLLKQYPSLGAPAGWDAHTIRSWLDRAREALGPSEGHSGVTLSHPDLSEMDLLREIVGDPIADEMRAEMHSALSGGY